MKNFIYKAPDSLQFLVYTETLREAQYKSVTEYA